MILRIMIPLYYQLKKCVNVRFGNYRWAGTHVSVVVNFGENSIVGANSVVTKDIPLFEIWGGVPAKFISRKKIA